MRLDADASPTNVSFHFAHDSSTANALAVRLSALSLRTRRTRPTLSSPPTCPPSSLPDPSFSLPLRTALLLPTQFPRIYTPAMGSDFDPRRRIVFRGAGILEDIEEGRDSCTGVARGRTRSGADT